MRDRIAELAKANNRSMNAEIVARLERSLAQEASAPTPIDQEFLADVEKRAAEWGCSKTRALIRMTIEEIGKEK